MDNNQSQDTGRLILFMVLSVGIMLIWGYLFPPPKQIKNLKKKQNVATSQPATRPSSKPASRPSSRPTTPTPAKKKNAAPIQKHAQLLPSTSKKAVPLKKLAHFKPRSIHVKGELQEVTLTNRGASIVQYSIKKFYDPKSSPKKRRPLELFDQRYRKYTQAFFEHFFDKNLQPHRKILYTTIQKLDKKGFKVKFVGQIPAKKGGYLEVEKIYTLHPKKYSFEVEFHLKNKTSVPLSTQMALILQDFKPLSERKSSGWFRAPKVFQALCQFQKEKHPERIAHASLVKELKKNNKKDKSFGKPALYAAIDGRYFIKSIIPHWGKNDQAGSCVAQAKLNGYLHLDIRNVGTQLPAGQTYSFKYIGYVGPKYYELLKAVDPPSKLEQSIDFGIFAFLCRPLLWLMQLFYNWLSYISLANWGLVIILLTLFIKLLLYPLSVKSMKSMKAMQALKPELDKLKEKYGDDKDSLNRETMNLYAKHGVNPVGGCGPMLLQMPIWFALYNTLFYAVELYQSPFIPGWIDDLSSHDPYYILPILLGVFMFLQQKLNPTTGMDESQAKIMSFLPLLFTGLMIFLPAGLTLYIFLNTFLGVIHQWHINKLPDEPPTPKKKSSFMQKLYQMAEEQNKQ